MTVLSRGTSKEQLQISRRNLGGTHFLRALALAWGRCCAAASQWEHHRHQSSRVHSAKIQMTLQLPDALAHAGQANADCARAIRETIQPIGGNALAVIAHCQIHAVRATLQANIY